MIILKDPILFDNNSNKLKSNNYIRENDPRKTGGLVMKVKLNADLGGFKAGKVLQGEILKTHYWRNRIKDSKIDNCVTIIDEFKPPKPVESKEEKNREIPNRRKNK